MRLLVGRACRRAWRASLAVFLGVVATAVLGAAPAQANAGKVLVFTGTAGTPNASSADVASAISALGTANDFSVDTSASAADINAANLAGYRAVVFVNSSGDVLPAAAETDLTNYVNNGGGFVGIGETALLEQGGAAFFNTLIGLTGATRATGAPATSTSDVEYLDRVHPATRDLPVLAQDTDPFYAWTTLPTGTVQTVARVRGNMVINTPGDTPFSVTNDAVQKFTGTRTTRFSRSWIVRRRGVVTSARAVRSIPRSARRARRWRRPTPRSFCSVASSGRRAWCAVTARRRSTRIIRRRV